MSDRPEWMGRLGGAVDWSPDPEIEFLTHLMDDILEEEDITEHRRYELLLRNASTLIRAKENRTSFSPQDLREWLLRIVRIIRTHVTDEKVFRRIARDIYAAEIQTHGGENVRPVPTGAERLLEAPRSEPIAGRAEID